MKVTLWLEDQLVKEVQRIATERATTLTGLIRYSLEQLARENAASGRKRRELAALERSFERFHFKVGRRTWKRTDLRPISVTAPALRMPRR